MKCYYYGEPSRTVTNAVFAAKKKAMWLRFPAVAIAIAIWLVLMPPALLFIKLGEIGHAVAGWCGFDSRDW